MKRIKKWLAAAVCVALAAALCACSMVTVNEEKDNAQTVAVVNGTEIKKKDFVTVLGNMLYSYGMTEEALNSSENKQEMLESALDEVVGQELLYQAAKEEGLVDDSEEHKAEVKEELQQNMDSMKSYYEGSAETPEEGEQAYQDYVTSMGYDDLDQAVERNIRQTAITDMYTKITEEVDYSEEQAREYYDMQVEAQKSIIDEDASKFALYQQFGESYYNPPGAKYVKNLLIAIPDDKQAEISALREAGNDADADVLRDEELAKIKSEADAALARVKDGEAFDALIEELGDDPGMAAEPAKTYGYLVYEDSNYVDEFEEAALALANVGDTTDLVPSDFGYHIIEYVADGAGAVEFDMVKDDIISSQKSAAQSNRYYEYIEEMKEKADIKTYPNRLELHG